MELGFCGEVVVNTHCVKQCYSFMLFTCKDSKANFDGKSEEAGPMTCASLKDLKQKEVLETNISVPIWA